MWYPYNCIIIMYKCMYYVCSRTTTMRMMMMMMIRTVDDDSVRMMTTMSILSRLCITITVLYNYKGTRKHECTALHHIHKHIYINMNTNQSGLFSTIARNGVACIATTIARVRSDSLVRLGVALVSVTMMMRSMFQSMLHFPPYYYIPSIISL